MGPANVLALTVRLSMRRLSSDSIGKQADDDAAEPALAIRP
jgi:hypothetical protein